jgi:uncharacterized SAM-binding protein YcdF (DUF218 family)
MAGFLYSALLTLLDPVTIVLLLLIAAALSRRRWWLRPAAVIIALLVMLTCGNRWVIGGMLQALEWESLPPDPMPTADAIVVLSGGTLARVRPRDTIEVSDAGDRVLYAGALFRRGQAPMVIVTGDTAIGGVASRPAADDMAELLQTVGVPESSIVLERKAQNTHDHAVNVCPMLEARQVRHVLLVTSALHMRRALGVFRHACGTIRYTPAPTDFRVIEPLPRPWYHRLMTVVPTSRTLADFSDAAHEHVGLVYYRLRGWT